MPKILTLGESLLRLSTTKNERLRNLTELKVVFGGAEANVANNLAMLDNEVIYATKLPKSELSQNVVYQLKGVGVNTDNVIVKGNGRVGSYFVEVGSDLRASSVIYDRKYSSIATMDKKEWDLDKLFSGVTHFHTTGITLGLSDFWQGYLLEIIKYAKNKGVKIFFDVNFRSGLWTQAEAKIALSKVFPLVDYISANKLDAKYFMDIDTDFYDQPEQFIKEMSKAYPNFKVIFGTQRESLTPNSYNFTGFYYDTDSEQLFNSKKYHIQYVNDRVGAGDAYAAGIIDGVVKNKNGVDIVNFATASSVLKHTIFGDANNFTSNQIEQFMNTQGGNIIR